MTRRAHRLLAATSLLLAGAASAADGGPRASLYDRLGGEPGVAAIASELTPMKRDVVEPAAAGAHAVIALLAARTALAAPVSVHVTDSTGAPAEDAVVMFDPLDTTPPPRHDTAVVDQIDRTFVPRVSVVRAGTSVTFPNSDHIRHQVCVTMLELPAGRYRL
ncbi:MAG TPA: hypothetical protein VHW65_04140, partial [Gemmatimonadales bacterium]|nr:hypothetical protein [Gemmatimonadales bacterium]